jgi:hypothetical protein
MREGSGIRWKTIAILLATVLAVVLILAAFVVSGIMRLGLGLL